MGKMSREKGKRGEREAAAEIQRLFGVEARRGAQHCGGPDAPDIRTAIERVHFEVKRTESFRLYDALAQAINDAGNAIPVVLHRSNAKPWVAIVRLNDLPMLSIKCCEVLREITPCSPTDMSSLTEDRRHSSTSPPTNLTGPAPSLRNTLT